MTEEATPSIPENNQPAEAPVVAPATPAAEPPVPQAQPAAPDAAEAPEEEPKKKRKKRWIVLTLLLLLLIGALVAAVVWLMQPRDDGPLKPDPNVKIGALTDMGDLEKILDEGMLTFSINATPAFESGTSEGNLLIENPEINNNRFTVTIYKDDDKEVVYQSGYLDPGQYIENAKLDVVLPEGTYKCTAQFQTYKLDTDKPIGQAAAEVTLYVLS